MQIENENDRGQMTLVEILSIFRLKKKENLANKPLMTKYWNCVKNQYLVKKLKTQLSLSLIFCLNFFFFVEGRSLQKWCQISTD